MKKLLMSQPVAFNPERKDDLKSSTEAIEKPENGTKLDEFLPPRPKIIKGNLKKVGNLLLILKDRFFVINPDDGTLMRYKSEKHYPMKPIEIIPLKDITHVKRNPVEFGLRKKYFYLEFIYNKRFILAANSEHTINQWVRAIYKSILYSQYVDKKAKSNPNDEYFRNLPPN
jgi:serum/glucocorticoid-regulated kinase 2